ncbi:MAG: pilus assembly protein PilB [Acidimicrobiales bacterium]|nr:pilus assembly protein PilB [Acidimicrobiales bacterium]
MGAPSVTQGESDDHVPVRPDAIRNVKRRQRKGSGLVANAVEGDVLDDVLDEIRDDDLVADDPAPGGFDGPAIASETREAAGRFGLQAASLDEVSLDPKAVALLPEEKARELSAVPLSLKKDRLSVAVSDPGRAGLEAELAEATGMTPVLVVASEADVLAAIDRAYQAATTVNDAVRIFEARQSERSTTVPEASTEVDATAPVVQVVSQILSQAVRDRASDVHIEPMGERVRIRNRVDGALHEVLSLPQSMAQALVSRIKIMADMNIVERRRPQDGQIEIVIDGNELDIRVSTTSTVHGEKTVLRILDKARALYDVATLGMPADTAAVYRDIIRSPYGMVVCAGPTGSGKTTTLYASLMAINSDEINVMTVEDPVEYSFPTINQIGIHEQAGVTFAAGLRSILRQDPDAILVGEIRDVETARIAIQAALTGHFVLSTIHATDATSALHRFLDMGIESFLLASSMLAVVGQRLIRRNCPDCQAPYQPSTEDLAFYERANGKPKDVFLKGQGCTTCSGTGYLGRIGVYEVLRVTDEMRELIVRNAPVDDIRKLAIEQGMAPLRDQALRLVADDVTTIAEVMRTIYIL